MLNYSPGLRFAPRLVARRAGADSIGGLKSKIKWGIRKGFLINENSFFPYLQTSKDFQFTKRFIFKNCQISKSQKEQDLHVLI